VKLIKRSSGWDKLVLVLSGQLDATREVRPSNVETSILLSIGDIGLMFDQIQAIDDYSRPKYGFWIRGSYYILTLAMATELQGIVEQAWFDYEYATNT
jgi:hypothetical protein